MCLIEWLTPYNMVVFLLRVIIHTDGDGLMASCGSGTAAEMRACRPGGIVDTGEGVSEGTSLGSKQPVVQSQCSH